jgi:hypothetical protein
MPGWPSRRRFLSRRLGAAALLLALAGCGGGGGDTFAPLCPVPALQPDLADLTRYRPTGHDITDMIVDARITAVHGACKPGGKDKLSAGLKVSFQFARGPAATGRTADAAYFAAVIMGDQILDKRVYPLHVEFPANTETVQFDGDPIDMVLPTPPGTTGAAYRVEVGFQLTPQELAVNRARGPR